MKAIPLTVKVAGATLFILLPGTRVLAFLLGIVFWMILGPLVKWAIMRYFKQFTIKMEKQ